MSPRLEPEHPASRSVVDEQGRFHMLGLSEAELRLECVRLVNSGLLFESHSPTAADLVSAAAVLAAFVLGTAPVVSNQPEPVNLKAGEFAAFGKGDCAAVGSRATDPHAFVSQSDLSREVSMLRCEMNAGFAKVASLNLPDPMRQSMPVGNTARANPPERPALSEEVRAILLAEMQSLYRWAARDEEAATAARARAEAETTTAESWACAAASQRAKAEQIARDLGKPEPSA